nr:unnamed protein product [Rangifer tarandus platyrhynchus]
MPKPARCQHSSSTSAIPGPTASFAAARAFGSTASGRAGLAPAPGRQDFGHHATTSGRGAFVAGPAAPLPGGRCGACRRHKAARKETPRGSGLRQEGQGEG